MTCISQTFAQPFVHPGGLHTQADLDRMKAKVAAGAHPWIDDWNLLLSDPKAQNTYNAHPQANMGVSRQRAQDDATSAYLNALRWSISGDTSYADCAMRNLNSWSATVDQVPHGNDQPGLGGIPIGNFALAAEVLRTYPGWSAEDQTRFKRMLLDYFYPVCHDFLTNHNGGGPSRYWANWDTANMLSILAIGVCCDDRAKFDEAVEYFKHGQGRGAIENAVPFIYPGGLGQWQESGRDQAHTMGGMGLLTQMCQVAWNQGVDLFGYDDNRLLKGAEYVAQYTLWKGVPYTFYNNSDEARQFYVAQNYHGRLDASHFELLYNHYVVLKGLKAPHVQLLAALRRPEPGETDVLGYGTLAYTLDANASPLAVAVPPVPLDVTATAGVGRVDLQWSPSGAYSARGYDVSRATTKDGPFTSIYSTTRWTTPSYTDTTVEAGKTYYYGISAINQVGQSAPSVPVSATPVVGATLPTGWNPGVAEGAQYSETANGSFVVPAVGAGIGNSTDDCNFVSRAVSGDFTLTARLIDRRGPVNMVGLMMRETADKNAKTFALTLGEVGGRQARVRTRTNIGEKTTVQLGNDYTWSPVWFRLRRQGDVFTAYQSSDGIEWFEVGKSTIAMSPSYQVGFVASRGNAEATPVAQAFFDHASLEVNPPVPPSALSGLKANSLGNGTVRLNWKSTPGNATGIKIEASMDNAPFYEIADLQAGTTFVNTGVRAAASLRYRIRAYNTGGYSAYSNIAAVR